MSASCCNNETPKVEIGAGLQSDSLSLLADAVDFSGDALNYSVSLAVLASALAWRARAAILKEISIMGFGLYVLGAAVWSRYRSVPQAMTMGAVALLALLANVVVAWMLYAFRKGDANMRGVGCAHVTTPSAMLLCSWQRLPCTAVGPF